MEDNNVNEHPFSYNKISLIQGKTALYSKDGRFLCPILVTNKDFIGVLGMFQSEKKPTTEGDIFKKYGLKFHIGLPEKLPEKYKLGWEIISNILMKNDVTSFKIVKPGLMMSGTQRGKDITIYANDNPEKSSEEWQNIFTEITKALVSNNIPPGYRTPGTEKKEGYLLGSNYISYRYYDEFTQKSIWPKDDPCVQIKINVENQLEIPEWKPGSTAGNNLINLFK